MLSYNFVELVLPSCILLVVLHEPAANTKIAIVISIGNDPILLFNAFMNFLLRCCNKRRDISKIVYKLMKVSMAVIFDVYRLFSL